MIRASDRDNANRSEPLKTVGGPCSYVNHAGNCTVASVQKTAASIYQGTIKGGPGYEGFEVRFTYHGENLSSSKLVTQALGRSHELRLLNSWHPGPRFLDKYAVTAGKTFPCTLRVIEKGSCTPIMFEFSTIDRSDYLDNRR